MSMSMLDSMFPDSIWKYGTLSEPVEEVDDRFIIEPKPRTKRRGRRKTIKQTPRKRRLLVKRKILKKAKKRNRRAMVKPRQNQSKKPAPRIPTVAEYLRSQRESTLQRRKLLEMAEKMKARAMVKARQVRLERLLSEIPASGTSHFRGKKSRTTRKRKDELAQNKTLRDEIRMWQRRIEKIRFKESAYQRDLKKVKAANVIKAVPPLKYLYS